MTATRPDWTKPGEVAFNFLAAILLVFALFWLAAWVNLIRNGCVSSENQCEGNSAATIKVQ